MGTVKVSAILGRCNELAEDEGQVTWTSPQGIAWVNDAQRAIALVRPDASVSRGSMTLSPGVTQTISGRRLVAVHWNTGSSGTTRGKAIRLVERGIKDDLEPDWPAETPATEVLEYMYDERNPRTFDVSPPVSDTVAVNVEITQVVNPADVADESDPTTLDDTYVPAMIEWIMYRFFSRESEETPSYARAAGHFRNFFNLLGVKLQRDMAVSPQVRAHLEEGNKK